MEPLTIRLKILVDGSEDCLELEVLLLYPLVEDDVGVVFSPTLNVLQDNSEDVSCLLRSFPSSCLCVAIFVAWGPKGDGISGSGIFMRAHSWSCVLIPRVVRIVVCVSSAIIL